MSMQLESTIVLSGDGRRLVWADKIISDALNNAGLIDLKDFLKENNLLKPGVWCEGGDSNHLSLLAYLFCPAENVEEVVSASWRDFISGCCITDTGDLELDLYGSDTSEFFQKLVDNSEYLVSYKVTYFENEDDDEDNEEDDDEEDDEEDDDDNGKPMLAEMNFF